MSQITVAVVCSVSLAPVTLAGGIGTAFGSSTESMPLCGGRASRITRPLRSLDECSKEVIEYWSRKMSLLSHQSIGLIATIFNSSCLNY